MLSSCSSCEVPVGEYHVDGCVEDYCRLHGHLVFGMSAVELHANGCRAALFNGFSLGEVEATSHAWWAKVVGMHEVPCEPWEWQAYPDTSRVIRDLEWDPVVGVFHDPSPGYKERCDEHLAELERQRVSSPEMIEIRNKDE